METRSPSGINSTSSTLGGGALWKGKSQDILGPYVQLGACSDRLILRVFGFDLWASLFCDAKNRSNPEVKRCVAHFQPCIEVCFMPLAESSTAFVWLHDVRLEIHPR